jgi:DNA-binding response OmpR family regulator
MRERILIVGYDQNLLFTRACILNTRWSAEIAYPVEALRMLEEEPFELIVLCHSLAGNEAASLARAARKTFPNVFILALETSAQGDVHPLVWADAVTITEPSKMLDAIEGLLGSGKPCAP